MLLRLVGCAAMYAVLRPRATHPPPCQGDSVLAALNKNAGTQEDEGVELRRVAWGVFMGSCVGMVRRFRLLWPLLRPAAGGVAAAIRSDQAQNRVHTSALLSIQLLEVRKTR